MNDNDFQNLVASIKQAAKIAKGGLAPANKTYLNDNIDVANIRHRIGLSQAQFAALVRVSPRTIQNWEQHRRSPTGPALALLVIMNNNTEMAIKALH